MRHAAAFALLLGAASYPVRSEGAQGARGEGDPEALKKSLDDKDVAGTWIYNDLAAGFAEARKSRKPLLVVFR
jgi:hypothetical protein